MTASVRSLVEVAVALGSDDREGLATALRSAAAVSTATEVDEALLQSYLFVGYPRVLQAFQLWREISDAPMPAESADDAAHWPARGAIVFERVYGAQHERLLDNVVKLHPDLERWMVVEGYGKVLSRPGLQLVTRELCIVALLATQDAMQQLYSHLRGALHVGAEENDVEETLMLALANASVERKARAMEAWETVKSRRRG